MQHDLALVLLYTFATCPCAHPWSTRPSSRCPKCFPPWPIWMSKFICANPRVSSIIVICTLCACSTERYTASKKAFRKFYGALCDALERFRLTPLRSDPSILTGRDIGYGMWVVAYVDDLLIIGRDKSFLENVIGLSRQMFTLCSLEIRRSSS